MSIFTRAVYWSIVASVVGVPGTWFGLVQLDRRGSQRQREVCWLLGMAALGLAWLIGVLELLNRMTGRIPDVTVAACRILSGAAAVLGVILTDAMVRHLRESGKQYPRYSVAVTEAQETVTLFIASMKTNTVNVFRGQVPVCRFQVAAEITCLPFTRSSATPPWHYAHFLSSPTRLVVP